jgi:hypothetical protein
VIATPDLIESLAANAAPVRRLRPPLARAALWLALAIAILVLLAIGRGVRPDIADRLRQWVFLVGLAAALLTGVLASIAAFLVSLPDRPLRWLLLPAPAAAVWAATIGYGCLTNWISLGPDGIEMGESLRCFSTLAMTSVPLSVALVFMLRHAAPIRPTSVTMMGGLAVAGMAAAALSLFHDLDATIMVLIFNLGTAAAMVGLGGVFGRKAFSWVATGRPRLENG